MVVGTAAVGAVRFELEREDLFEGAELDSSLWIPHYLPQWSSREASRARYVLGDGTLRLCIEEDQQPWCPEFDGQLRVSNLQTGVLAGPLGSREGQHRFNPDVVVREAQAPRLLYTPHYGRFELRAKALADPRCMVALWMIGVEDVSEHSAEICVMEVFGRDVEPHRARVGMGVHPFGDPRISDEFEAVPLDLDAREFHTYAVDWLPGRVEFAVDGRPVKVVHQAPDYPMQFMLDVFEFRDQPAGDEPHPYPKEFVVDSFRGYRPVGVR
ncbi:glycosyl hydrolase family 16 [Kineococcus xinjiangensis]|uniref:Glycosyl hydrolase family 16 n=1 Tax=Kineococcus xinjiangensis TaxID=512762 RepID=A0A2S6ITX0_9ACTN|nr:glycoside hydrolase family 16 protein [Kineococcus xinjiangensis]PPK97506.1 glycosyl hydrolase family 16 [Kineococcus xinjiangensis]